MNHENQNMPGSSCAQSLYGGNTAPPRNKTPLPPEDLISDLDPGNGHRCRKSKSAERKRQRSNGKTKSKSKSRDHKKRRISLLSSESSTESSEDERLILEQLKNSMERVEERVKRQGKKILKLQKILIKRRNRLQKMKMKERKLEKELESYREHGEGDTGINSSLIPYKTWRNSPGWRQEIRVESGTSGVNESGHEHGLIESPERGVGVDQDEVENVSQQEAQRTETSVEAKLGTQKPGSKKRHASETDFYVTSVGNKKYIYKPSASLKFASPRPLRETLP